MCFFTDNSLDFYPYVTVGLLREGLISLFYLHKCLCLASWAPLMVVASSRAAKAELAEWKMFTTFDMFEMPVFTIYQEILESLRDALHVWYKLMLLKSL